MTELKELEGPAESGRDPVRGGCWHDRSRTRWKSADEFHKQLGMQGGVILTKMDGDARGGAALSIRSVTGQPLEVRRHW